MPACDRHPRHPGPYLPVIDGAGSYHLCGLCALVVMDDARKLGITVSLVLTTPAEVTV